MSSECIFCGIVAKKIPAKICKETPHLIAFFDIAPQAPVHVLIIPKKHIVSVKEFSAVDAPLAGEMFLTAQEIAREQGVDGTGFRLVINCGPNAGQAVNHLHLHLLGNRKLSWPPG